MPIKPSLAKSNPLAAVIAKLGGEIMPKRRRDSGKCDPHKGDVPRGARTLAGVTSGALFGFAVGGPAGAMFGGMAGLIIGASSDVGAYMDEW